MENKSEKKRYNFREQEPYWQNFWNEKGVYNFDPESYKPLYTIDTPPPTISGSIHLGHIYSYTHAEIIARYKRQAGFNVRYPFGYDNNGLPTEKLVEKEKGVRGRDMALSEFVKMCLEVTDEYKINYQRIWQKVALSCDWRLEYSTISPEIQKLSQSVFKELFEKDYIYQKESPVLYCPECSTSIAQAEVEDKEFESKFYDIIFKSEGGKDVAISTTRPELLPACVAVFINPADKRYSELNGKKLITPLGASVTVLTDEKVAIDKGTGVVMCCTYGDETDVYWVKKYELDENVIIDLRGKLTTNDSFPEIAGKSIHEGREIIVEYLKKKNLLKAEKPIIHSVGVHERCGTPIELLPTKQWFVKMLDIKDEILAAGDKIKWHPDFMNKRFRDWVENLKWDWCISRERFYGIPIPIFYCDKCKIQLVPDVDKLPIDPRTSQDIECPKCKGKNLRPERNVLDTWFTSSLTPSINNNHPTNGKLAGKMLPMSMRPQAHDIIRTWVVYTVVMSHYRQKDIPWHELMISGHILLRSGQKISKKTGGGDYDPESMIDEKSADAVRYAMCSASLGRDAYFEEAEVEKGKKLITKLYNAVKLSLMLLEDYKPTELKHLLPTDSWIIEKSHLVAESMTRYFDRFEASLALKEFEEFFWADYCDNYLEIAKSRIFSESFDEKDKESARYALYNVSRNILFMIAPFMPHIAEELYHANLIDNNLISDTKPGKLAGEELSVHRCSWPKKVKQTFNDDTINALLSIISEIRKYKSSNQMNLGASIGFVHIDIDEKRQAELKDFIDDIKATTKTEDIVFLKNSEAVTSIKI